jgi:aconitate hydratase
MLVPPLPGDAAKTEQLVKGPNIKSLPDFEPLPDRLEVPVLLKVGDNVSTDEIMPAGQKVLPFRSNIPAISDFVYYQVDETYVQRARETGDHAIVGGDNYGQGSSREHAAIAPRHLGLRVVVAKSFARIHRQNLANFGILALTFADPADFDALDRGDVLHLEGLHDALRRPAEVPARVGPDGATITLAHALSPRQVDMLLAGGLIPVFKQRLTSTAADGGS